MKKSAETIFLVAFFKFDSKDPEYGFERINLQHIWKSEIDAREHLSFCDEAGWYEGILIEERPIGWGNFFKGKRVWLIQEKGGTIKEIEEPKYYNNCLGLIG